MSLNAKHKTTAAKSMSPEKVKSKTKTLNSSKIETIKHNPPTGQSCMKSGIAIPKMRKKMEFSVVVSFKASVRALQILGRARLIDVLGTRWALIHATGLNILRQLHPRRLDDEYIENNINWSAVLDLSATGLLKLPGISHYADAWASEAARWPETFKSFASWHGFLGTPEQILIDECIQDGRLAARTAKNMLMCSYQLHSELMDSRSASEFNAALRSAGCSFKPITNQFFHELIGQLDKAHAV
jgi:hypothetical protein